MVIHNHLSCYNTIQVITRTLDSINRISIYLLTYSLTYVPACSGPSQQEQMKTREKQRQGTPSQVGQHEGRTESPLSNSNRPHTKIARAPHRERVVGVSGVSLGTRGFSLRCSFCLYRVFSKMRRNESIMELELSQISSVRN